MNEQCSGETLSGMTTDQVFPVARTIRRTEVAAIRATRLGIELNTVDVLWVHDTVYPDLTLAADEATYMPETSLPPPPRATDMVTLGLACVGAAFVNAVLDNWFGRKP